MDNQTTVSIKFKNSVTGQSKLEKYAETLKQINGVVGAIDTGKQKQIEKNSKLISNETKDMAKNFNTAFNVSVFNQVSKTIVNVAKNITNLTKKSAEYWESMNLLKVAFGESATGAKKFVNSLSELYGLDEAWVTKTTGLFKQLANAMNLTGEIGTDLAETLTQLSIDLSSLYNIDVNDAVSKLQSALAGQTKPVRFFGADITQDTLQLTLETHGIDRAISDLSYAEKRLVIVASILEQTEEAQGDWGRTMNSVANQMRIFTQQTDRLTRALGDVFMPILYKILPPLNAIMMVLTEIISIFATWVATLLDFNPEDAISSTNASLEEMDEGFKNATESAGKLKSGLRGFDKLNNITTPTASSGGSGSSNVDKNIMELYAKASESYAKKLGEINNKATEIRDKIMSWLGFTKLIDEETGDISFKFEKITGGTVLGALVAGGAIVSGAKMLLGILSKIGLVNFGGLAGGLSGLSALAVPAGIVAGIGLLSYAMYDLYKTNDEFANSVNEKWAGIQEAIQPVVEVLLELFGTLYTTYEETLKPMLETIYEILQVIGATILEVIYPVLTEFIIPAIQLIIQIVNDCFTIINELWEKYGKPISEAIKKAIEGVAETFRKLWEQFLKPIIDKVMAIVKDLWENTLKPLFQNLGEVIGELVLLILNLWNNVFQPLVNYLVDKFGPIFEAVFSFIGDVFHTVFKLIGGVINGILDILKGVIKFISGVFSGDWKKAWDGICDIFKGVGNILITIFESVVNFIIDLINGLIKAIFNGVKSLINGVLSTVESVADFFGFDVDLTISAQAPQIPKLSIPRLKTGIDFVPNDYFPAFLDYGERVLTKEENADYNKGIIRGENAVGGQPINATFIIQVGDEEVSKKVLNDLQDMAKSNGEPITIG